MKRVYKWLLAAALTMGTISCTAPPWFNTAEAFAVAGAEITTSIVAAEDPAIAPIATACDKAATDLVTALKNEEESQTPTNLGAVQAALTALQTDANQLEIAAGASTTQDLIVNAALVTLQATIASIEAQVPGPVASSLNLKVRAKAVTYSSPDAARKAFNKAVKGDKRFKPLHVSFLHKL